MPPVDVPDPLRPDPPPRPPRRPLEVLRAGPLQMLYDPASGFLRRIRLGDREVLRGIYAAVRDAHWNTVPVSLTECSREVLSHRFRIDLRGHHQQGDVDFEWLGSLSGLPDGTVRFTFDGLARSSFLRNRIGLCVLHPLRECAGARARQTRMDGEIIECRFPTEVEPQLVGQARFRNLRSVAHEIQDALWAEVWLDGEVFEMEDQRNWIDASFKTYGTPLELPFPVQVAPGTRIQQEVTLSLRVHPTPAAPVEIRGASPAESPVHLTPERAAALTPPAVGLGLATHGHPLAPAQAERLRPLSLAHLRVDLPLGAPGWEERWHRAVSEARQLGTHLELALHLPAQGDIDWRSIRPRLDAGRDHVQRILALRTGEAATQPRTHQEIRQALRDWKVPVGAGTDANFCELHREQTLQRCLPAQADFVFWSINPQVHASDDLSVMETIAALAALVSTARSFSNGRPLVITPITLRPRFNAVATGPDRPPRPGELPRTVDARQVSPLGAAWTLGCLATLAAAGVDALTFFETTGWRGVMELPEGTPDPSAFPSAPGAPFPLFHVFEAWASARPTRVFPIQAAAPDSAAGLGLGHTEIDQLLLANLQDRALAVDLRAFPEFSEVESVAPTPGRTSPGRGRIGPLPLEPWEVVRITRPRSAL